MPKPKIQVSIANTDYLFALDQVDTAGNHVIQRTLRGFPDAAPTSGRPSELNYIPHSFESQRGPLGIGLKSTYLSGRIWDEAANSLFPGLITLPPLKSTTAFPAGVTAVEFYTFENIHGELIMFGNNASGAYINSYLLYWRASGAAWTDSTAYADIDAVAPAATRNVYGACGHEGRTYICGLLGRGTGPDPITVAASLAGADPPTDWSRISYGSSATPISGTAYAIQSDGGNMFVVDYASNICTVKKSTDDGVNWPTTLAIIQSASAPRGNRAVMYGDGSGASVLDYWFTTVDGLWHVDASASTFELWFPFERPQSAYSGQLFLTPYGILFSDGPSVYIGSWDSNGGKAVKDLGFQGDNGLPLDSQGDVTAVWFIASKNWVVVAVGGQDASHKASVYICALTNGSPKDNWHRIYQNSTANKVIFGIGFSTEDDGIPRLHITEDNAVANDSDAFTFDYITENPEVQTAYKFATTGYVTRSRFDGNAAMFRKGFLKGRYRVDSLTATESLSIKYATDGGSLGSAQTITSGPVGELWTDGADGVGSDALDIYDEITMARDTTNTLSPQIRDMGYAYEVVALKGDNTPIRTWTFRISLSPDDYEPGSDTGSSEAARRALETILSNRPLVKLAIGQDAPVGSEVKVRFQPYETARKIGTIQDVVDIPFDPSGSVLVTAREVI